MFTNIMGFAAEVYTLDQKESAEKLKNTLTIFRERIKYLSNIFTKKIGRDSTYYKNKILECGHLSEEDKENFRLLFNTFSAEFLFLKESFFGDLRRDLYKEILENIGTSAVDVKNKFESAESLTALSKNILYYSTIGGLEINNMSLEYQVAETKYIYKIKDRDYHLIRGTIDEIIYIIDNLFAELEKKYNNLTAAVLIDMQMQKYIRDNKILLLEYEEKAAALF